MRVKQEYSKKPLSADDAARQLKTMGWVPEHKGLNAGMRQIAKLMLNSLWGKFGERIDKKQSEYCTEPKQWFDMLAKHRRGEVEIKTDVLVNSSH